MNRHAIEYVGILAGSLALALAASWTSLGTQIDNDAYGWMFRLHSPAPREPQSMILEIDEKSLKETGGIRRSFLCPSCTRLEKDCGSQKKYGK